MQYSAANWVKATDLFSAVSRMSTEFSCLTFDACLQQNYLHDLETRQHYEDLEKKYLEAEDICNLYLKNEIGLECLCYELNKIDLVRYVKQLEEYLPTYLITRFILNV